MRVKELIAILNKPEHLEKEVSIALDSHYGSYYDLHSDDIEIKVDEYNVQITERKGHE